MNRTASLVVLLALVMLAAVIVHWRGGQSAVAKLENKALKEEFKATGESVAISKETASKVDIQAHETRQRTEQAIKAIEHEITISPAVDAGPADDVGLRLAAEAYDRALRSACRVQRTSDCDAPAAAAE